MPQIQPESGGTFQVNSDDLLSTYPHFYTAGDAIRSSARSLNNSITQTVSTFDGDTQKKLQSLGNACVTNLQGLADALDEIATRLHQSALAIQREEGHNTRLFELNS